MATLHAGTGFNYDDDNLKENLGLLRRAFSSIKRRRRKKGEGSPSPSRLQAHQPLRSVSSHPAPCPSSPNFYFW